MALRNIRRLSEHTLETMRKLYKTRYPVKTDLVPVRVQLRCYTLLRTILVSLVTSFVAPELIEVDLFSMFTTRGFLLSSFVSPDGLFCDNI